MSNSKRRHSKNHPPRGPSRPAAKDWVQRVQQEFGFSPEEIRLGENHDIIIGLKGALPGSKMNEFFRASCKANPMSIGGEHKFAPDMDPEDIFDMHILVYRGIYDAIKDAYGAWPAKGSADDVDFGVGYANNKDDPHWHYKDAKGKTEYVLASYDVEYNRLMLTEKLFQQAKYLRAAGISPSLPHSALSHMPCKWNEHLYLAGYEETRHCLQHKKPDLKAEMDRQTHDLVEAGAFADFRFDPEDPDSRPDPEIYKGKNPPETDAGLAMYRALMRLRKQEVAR